MFEFLEQILIWLFVFVVIIICLIASPFILSYICFDVIRKQIYRHHIYIEMYREDDYNYYKDIAEREYGCYFFTIKDVRDFNPDFHHANTEVLVGATFCFLRSQDAVHFKLLNLIA